MMKTVCLIGRPNVGKSSIFNRLIKEKKAIISDSPGVTRDRIYGIVTYNDKKFSLIDTGGISDDNADFEKDIITQASFAIDEADTILFVVDGLEDLTPQDKKIRNILKKSNKEVIVLVNKIDNPKRMDNIYNYYELGFAQVLGVSAEHNIGFKELLDLITKDIAVLEDSSDDTLKFCFVGRPNVGKSSLINALLNEERVIVSDMAGTTRDAVDTTFTYNNEKYIITDTAGMRKKGKVYEELEKYSLMRSMKAIDKSDVCVLVIDAQSGIIEHDKHILSYCIDAGKGIVICVNKWDTVKDPNEDLKRWQQELEVYFKFVPYINFVFTSAKTKKRLNTLMPEVIKAYENNHKEIKTSLLNDVIMEATSLHEPPSYKGKRLKIYFTHQTGKRPPKFTFNVNNKKLVHFSYERYLENKLRSAFDLVGTPIILQFKNKNEDKID